MLRRMSKKCLSLLLALCMIVSVIAVGAVSTGAAEVQDAASGSSDDLAASGNKIVDAIIEKAIDQMIEDGMRLACMGLDWVGEATGNRSVLTDRVIVLDERRRGRYRRAQRAVRRDP